MGRVHNILLVAQRSRASQGLSELRYSPYPLPIVKIEDSGELFTIESASGPSDEDLGAEPIGDSVVEEVKPRPTRRYKRQDLERWSRKLKSILSLPLEPPPDVVFPDLRSASSHFPIRNDRRAPILRPPTTMHARPTFSLPHDPSQSEPSRNDESLELAPLRPPLSWSTRDVDNIPSFNYLVSALGVADTLPGGSSD
ncbi:hypothetical protein BDN72DRAFT_959696 [Pluteus cervinus]|uniref:Uncharacterized protein n=1 Tax=Pluteus cervinus TaxID=181527 RepID=A0ACD3AV44_9AGAR|nr:hypothetical protein BDN72DRAFT_959696 [Pluteus cervinus]